MNNSANRFASLMEIAPRPPITFTQGSGDWLEDADGRRYLDFVQGWAVNTLGHCPPELSRALAEQAGRLINCSPAFFNQPAVALADRLVAHCALDRVFFSNSGAEANEGAIKLARKWGTLHRGGAFEIIAFDHGFHGRTLATMSASGKPQWRGLFEPKVPGFTHVPLNDMAAVRAACTPKTVAVLLEPIQGEAGVHPAETGFLQELSEWTRANGLLLILDEVQTGMGRTGALFCHQIAGIEPDIMTLGKGMGGGAPLAALLAKEAVCCFEFGDQGGTFNGSALISAAGLAVLDAVLAPGFLEGVRERSRRLAEGLTTLSNTHGLGPVRGAGLLLALDLKREIGPDLVQAALEAGLLINAPRPDTLRFMPALNVATESIDNMLDILGTALRNHD